MKRSLKILGRNVPTESGEVMYDIDKMRAAMPCPKKHPLACSTWTSIITRKSDNNRHQFEFVILELGKKVRGSS